MKQPEGMASAIAMKHNDSAVTCLLSGKETMWKMASTRAGDEDTDEIWFGGNGSWDGLCSWGGGHCWCHRSPWHSHPLPALKKPCALVLWWLMSWRRVANPTKSEDDPQGLCFCPQSGLFLRMAVCVIQIFSLGWLSLHWLQPLHEVPAFVYLSRVKTVPTWNRWGFQHCLREPWQTPRKPRGEVLWL